MKIEECITVDTSGLDLDRIDVRGMDGAGRELSGKQLFNRPLYDGIDAGTVTLPDGTPFTRDELQLAFQNELIRVTGKCVLEHEYERAGYHDLAEMARQARS